MLEGVLDKFLEEVNKHTEPIREEIMNLDRLTFLFFMIGSLGTMVVGALLYLLVSLYAFISVCLIYLIALGFVYYRSFRKQQILHQTMVLNMAMLIYLANHNVFY